VISVLSHQIADWVNRL